MFRLRFGPEIVHSQHAVVGFGMHLIGTCLLTVKSAIVRLGAVQQLEAVVRRILWVKAKDPNAKVLLFSEWQDVLDVVEHALTANHITFARIKERGSTTPLPFFLI